MSIGLCPALARGEFLALPTPVENCLPAISNGRLEYASCQPSKIGQNHRTNSLWLVLHKNRCSIALASDILALQCWSKASE